MTTTNTPVIKVMRADTDALYNHVFDIRTTVFVEGESIDQEDEYDGFDHLANHYLAYYEDVPAGAARWRRLNNGSFRLERVAVLNRFRGKGIGRALVLAMVEELPGEGEIFIHAQVKNTAFYEKLHFEVEGEEFEEAQIPHVKMVYRR